MSTIEISVVIPCFNAETTIRETLEGLLSQEWDGSWEVVVVDNLSTDKSMDIVKEYQSRIPMIRICSATQQGQPYALNEGVRAASGKSIVFCDTDDVPAPGWLKAMAEALRTHECVASRMDLLALNPEWIARTRINAQTKGLEPIGYPPYLLHAGGGTLGVRKTVFEQVKGFDPILVCLHDTDFCFKVQKAGYGLHFVTDAVMQIRLRTTEKGTFQQAKNWAAYNVLLAKRYRGDGQPPPRRWKRFFKDTFRSLKLAIKLAIKLAKLSKEERMHTYWALGWQLGKIIGVIKYRAPPF